ncbi:MAG: amidohydrolase family protein [Pseudomonadota bacterium]
MQPFIDAHHHLWNLTECNYPWLMARGETRFFGDPTPIQKNYLVEDFLDESSRYRPTKSVHIQVGVAARDQLNESRWLQQLGEYPHAIVAACDLTAAGRDAELEQQRQFSKVRGVRQILGRHLLEDRKHNSDQLIESAEFEHGLRRLAALGLAFDLQLIPQQMRRVQLLLKGIPELPVALCHCGSPWEQSGQGFRNWKAGLHALAELPNLVCKISGLGMFNPSWSVASLGPIVETVIETFGPERVMLGSNFPVDKLYREYEELWEAYAQLLASYSEVEQMQMRYKVAERFYRI